MEPTSDLFGTAKSLPVAKDPVRWMLVTNQRNLLYMLAAGLVMPPKGFGKKYYRDTLENFPGWIPLFSDAVPKQAIEYSIGERSHLIPCIATMNLSSLRGTVMAVEVDGAAKEIHFPDGLDGSEKMILIPAPLPISWITSIAFQSREDKANCEADARDFGNVPLNDVKREISARDFTAATNSVWPQPEMGIPVIEVALGAPFAAGGMMAMLLHLANHSEVGMKLCQLSFDAGDRFAQSIPDPLLASLGEWMLTGHPPDTSDVSSMLFWSIVEKVATNRFSEVPATPLDVVLSHLESEGERLGDRMHQALAKLASDLRTIASFSDSTITEIFERHPKTFSRVMTLFFLRDKCVELLEFKHHLLTESDYVAAAILFAAREGWLGLPLQLRSASTLQTAVSHRIAAMAHRIANTGLDLGPLPPRPIPLRELFMSTQKGWSNVQKEAALALARECKWDCIQTRVSLGKGDYRLVVDGGGVHILLVGEAKAVLTEVDRNQFFTALSQTPIPDKLDRKIRDLLKV
jgi:hypothetical protein